MDVMSIEHSFGNEFQTSIKQLFKFFCNNINLGQWDAAKACIEQLVASGDVLNFNFNQLIVDIILNPSVYCDGSDTVKSPYHLSLLLYNYCNKDGNTKLIKFNENESNIKTAILIKFLILTAIDEIDTNDSLIQQQLHEFINLNTFSDVSITAYTQLFTHLLLRTPLKFKKLFELLLECNENTDQQLLKIHLNTIGAETKAFHDYCQAQNDLTVVQLANSKHFNSLQRLFNFLFLYKSDSFTSQIKACLKNFFMDFFRIFSNNDSCIELRETLLANIYASLLMVNVDQNSNLIDTCVQLQYEVCIEMTIKKYELYPILSIIKEYYLVSFDKRRNILWRYLFLYCYFEKKNLIQSLIDECMLMIENSNFDYLTQLLNIKEFQNLKPLILLIGTTKIKDMHSLKRLIACLCLNSLKGSLIDKLGNLFKTHLDFMQWFQNLSSDKRKKDISFLDLVKLLNRQLPLNIICESIDINKLEYNEIMKILKNTLIDIETSEKTKWVRFVDEINEKICLIQDACLSVYNGFYCINRIIETVIYCCENLNKKFYQKASDSHDTYQTTAAAARARSATLFFYKPEQLLKDDKGLEALESDYRENVIKSFETIRKIVMQINSLNYRLELLENFYSIIYLMNTHIKDDEDDNDIDNTNNTTANYDNDSSMLNNNNSTSGVATTNDDEDYTDKEQQQQQQTYDILNSLLAESQQMPVIGEEASIYNNSARSKRLSQSSNRSYSSKSTLGGGGGGCGSNSYSSQNGTSLTSRNVWLRKNAGGGNGFLLNDFLCRDLLFLIKDLINDLKQKQLSDACMNGYISCSIRTKSEYSTRLIRLQQLINETIWRFHIVKNDSMPNEYGKVVCFNNSFDVNSNDELLAYTILRTQLKYDRSSSFNSNNSNTKTRSSSVNTQKSQKSLSLLTSSYNNQYKSNSLRKRTNLLVMKLLADAETLCVLSLKESKFNEANQLLKLKYNGGSGAKKLFAFEQIKFYLEYEQILSDVQQLSSRHETVNDLVLIGLFKIADRLIESEDSPLLKCILLTDLVTIANVNLTLTKNLIDYATSKLNGLNGDDEHTDDVLNKSVKEKLRIVLKNLNQLTNFSAIKSLTKFLCKLNSLNLCASESSGGHDDDGDDGSFLGLIRKYKDLNENLNKYKNDFDLTQCSERQNEIYLNLIKFMNDILGNLNLITKFYVTETEKTQRIDSNYLYSFYGYCKTLYEYFQNKTAHDVNFNAQSYFTILKSSPASLICKLLFENSLKPLLLEELTNKLNLNLTVILLHNSCPRLKLCNRTSPQDQHQQQQQQQQQQDDKQNELQQQQSAEQTDVITEEDEEEFFSIYETDKFYTILNKSDITWCSNKKPDVYVRYLLMKLLKYCKTFLVKFNSNKDTALTGRKYSLNTINLNILYEMYDCAEIKSILNETQELQHINLNLLKTNEEKLSFFINLHNLLTIHAYFQFASIQRFLLKKNETHASTASVTSNECLFRNNTEKVLLQQRMCYKIGQMGFISLFDLKYLILNCYQKFNNSMDEALLKYGLFNLDLNIEPIWLKYIPNGSEMNAKILFALVNCCESDQPICVFDSETQLFKDQLQVHMNTYLNENIFCDLVNGLLYLPNLLLDNIYLFNPATKPINTNQQENLINFLLENVTKPLSDSLKQLIDSYSAYGENIDEYGCKELSFKIIQLNESKRFLIKLDYSHANDSEGWYKMQYKKSLEPKPKSSSQPLDLNEHDDTLNADFIFQNKQLNADCLDYINTKSPLISDSLGFLFNDHKRDQFFNELYESIANQQNSLNRFIQLYVPLDYLKHLNMNMKLNFIIKFLLINYQQTSNDESKIELIIYLANYFANRHEWNFVLNLLNNFTLDNSDNDDFTDIFDGFIQTQLDNSQLNTNQIKDVDIMNNSKFSYKDLYNLYDLACICSACKEATINEKSYHALFKMKNFLKQLRTCLSLLYLWPIEGCLEIIEFCINKLKTYDVNVHYLQLLNEKKIEFEAYRVLTKCAKLKLEKYFDEQQHRDDTNGGDGDDTARALNRKIKKICQICLTWQTAKKKLETCVKSDDYETIGLIIDLLINEEKYVNAKYLCAKYELNAEMKFNLDYLHLKSLLFNINYNTIITLIDFQQYIQNKECITFNRDNLFDLCFKLLTELKCSSNTNNTIIISICEYLVENYASRLSDTQINEIKVLQLTSKIFVILLQERVVDFDAYKRHYEQPLVIIEQLLMNSKIDLCSKVVRLCREFLNENNRKFTNDINAVLVKYAKKALKFRTPTSILQASQIDESSDTLGMNKNKSPTFKDLIKKTTSSRASVDYTNLSGSPMISTSLKSKSSYLTTPPSTSATLQQSTSYTSSSSFIMPLVPPTKDQWVKDETVSECMVCTSVSFNLMNRRHHCRRCGRVVCSNCSQHQTIINDVAQRTCTDCFIQLETLNEKRNSNKKPQTSGDLDEGLSKRLQKTMKINVRRKASEIMQTTNDDQQVYWELYNDTEQDQGIKDKFRYQQAPSTSLCLSILDLHDDSIECGKELLQMCDELSSYLQTCNNSENKNEDFALILNMIKYLLCDAKVKLMENTSTSIISLCDTYLSLIDILEQLLIANCSNIPSLNDLRNQETTRRLRNRLLEEERHELAMNLSTKCGLDTQTVWASWGLIELKRGNYKEARSKYEKCLKIISDNHNQTINQSQLKILNDIIAYFETAPPIRLMGTLLAPLRSYEILIAEPVLYCTDDSNMDDIQLKESIYYLDTYGNHLLMVSFYQRRGYLQKSLQYLLDNKCNADVFVEALLTPCLKTGEFQQLLNYMQIIDGTQQRFHSYFSATGKYLEKNGYLNTLYEFQLFMKDFVRAAMSCIYFFSKTCENYIALGKNLVYLTKAREHLEKYLEIVSLRNSQPQLQLTWKHQKAEQQSLCKQMPPQEVDSYLNAINLQIDATKFLNNCPNLEKFKITTSQNQAPTLFGSNDTKINLCCLILLCGDTIQDGFGFVIRIIQNFNLNSTLVYSQTARELAKQYNFKEIHNLLKCINESGYQDDLKLAHDECISACIRVFSSLNENTQTSKTATSNASQQQQQYNKEIEELIQLIKDEQNKINAYVLTGRLKSAYLIAIKMENKDTVKHIAMVAERMGQNLIKDICNKWLDKYQSK